ncbi:hypothetical protein [Amycolatopsis sp. YIM 10]|uniref:hypothetical protein n=1 Tax=Amycolatopsis sp. YIM 10 TaxID=2653857 RepID=UPI00128FDE1A|nr:hypothetical protein [Amycolatopsis sp. YIM 10]
MAARISARSPNQLWPDRRTDLGLIADPVPARRRVDARTGAPHRPGRRADPALIAEPALAYRRADPGLIARLTAARSRE